MRDDQSKPQASEIEAQMSDQSTPPAAVPLEGDLSPPDPLLPRPIINQGSETNLPRVKAMATAVPTGGMAPLGDLSDGRNVLPGEERDEGGVGVKSLLRETLETVVLAVLIFLVIRSLVQNYRIEGQSMEPNFHHGQYLLVNKLAYRLGDYDRGDVIVFHYPNNPTQDYIKRVIGLPGDTVEISNGELFVNGRLVDEPYDQIPIMRNMSPQTVDPGFLYVLGDNRPASSDTRTWGQLSQEFVIGKAWLAIWPVEVAGVVKHPTIEVGSVMERAP